MFVSVAEVRAYLSLNSPGADSKYSDATISSNITAAGQYLEQACGRFFGDVTKTMTFSTDGRAQMFIPGLRTATSVTLQSTPLTADQTYWLLPDVNQTGVFTGIQLRAFGQFGYLGNPEWFDRDLDSWRWRAMQGVGRLPNDLVIVGAWGYTAATMTGMMDLLLACKALASWYTLRPDALLSGVRFTPEGNIFDLSRLPTEVSAFISEWRTGESMVLSG